MLPPGFWDDEGIQPQTALGSASSLIPPSFQMSDFFLVNPRHSRPFENSSGSTNQMAAHRISPKLDRGVSQLKEAPTSSEEEEGDLNLFHSTTATPGAWGSSDPASPLASTADPSSPTSSPSPSLSWHYVAPEHFGREEDSDRVFTSCPADGCDRYYRSEPIVSCYLLMRYSGGESI